MTATIADAHKAFQQKHPDQTIGLTTFYKLKPTNVRKVCETNRKCCLCQIYCNAAFVAEGRKEQITKVTKADFANICCVTLMMVNQMENEVS